MDDFEIKELEFKIKNLIANLSSFTATQIAWCLIRSGQAGEVQYALDDASTQDYIPYNN